MSKESVLVGISVVLSAATALLGFSTYGMHRKIDYLVAQDLANQQTISQLTTENEGLQSSQETIDEREERYIAQIDDLRDKVEGLQESADIVERLENDDAVIMREYQLIHGMEPLKLEVKVSDYFKLKAQDHQPNSMEAYTDFVISDSSQIKKLATAITQGYRSKEAKAQAILDFVQKNRTYDSRIEDEISEPEYARFPLETIVDGNGDCEDSSILTAALMKAKGIDVALIELRSPDESRGHMALGVAGRFKGVYVQKDQKRYYFAETTSKGWKIGQLSNFDDSNSSKWSRTVYPVK